MKIHAHSEFVTGAVHLPLCYITFNSDNSQHVLGTENAHHPL